MNKLIFLYNEKGIKKINYWELAAIYNIAYNMNYNPRIIFSKNPETVSEDLFKDQEYKKGDIIVSIGGDKTFYNLVKNTYDKDITISHLPHGTINDIKRVFGFNSNNIAKNLEDILNGEEKELDTPILNGTPFTYSAGCGKLLSIPYSVPESLKDYIGNLAYLSAGVGDLLFKRSKQIAFHCQTNNFDFEEKAVIILISNQNRHVGLDNFIRDCYVDDGLFEVNILAAKNNKDVLLSLIANFRNKLKSGTEYLKFSTDNVSFTFKDNPDFCIDGDKYDETTKKVNITMGRKKVLVPKNRIPNQFKR